MARVRKVSGGKGVQRMLAKIGNQLRNPATLRVGFLENAKYPDGKPVAFIAAIQEFGAPRAGIPPRPFFRNMIHDKQAEWPKAIKDLILANNYDMTAALDLAGAAIAGQLRQSIIDLWLPPLAESTIERKGFDKPLIETGHMLRSIDHEVRRV
jgi:hypothetical protein